MTFIQPEIIRFSDDFKGNRSSLIRSNSLNIRGKNLETIPYEQDLEQEIASEKEAKQFQSRYMTEKQKLDH